MKLFIVVIILTLMGATMRFGLKNLDLQKDLQAVSDTLNSQRLHQQLLEQKSFEFIRKFGENDIQFKDSTAEVHRIKATYGDVFSLLRFEQKSDNSIQSMFRKVKMKKPISIDLKHMEFVMDSAVQVIKPADFQHFKRMLDQTNLLEATKANQLMCCFGGGSISWEAYLKDGSRHYFSTFCRESIQFAEACEFLFRQIDDEDLKRYLN